MNFAERGSDIVAKIDSVQLKIEVKRSLIEGEFKVRCGCGSEMKKPYSPPVLANRDADREVLAPLFGTRVGP